MLQSTSTALPAAVDMDDLLARCLGNREFAEHILRVFHDRCGTDLEEIEKAVGAKDFDNVVWVAHRLQGACANAAAGGLKERTSQLRKAACEYSSEEVSTCLDELQKSWSQFVKALGPPDVTPGARSSP